MSKCLPKNPAGHVHQFSRAYGMTKATNVDEGLPLKDDLSFDAYCSRIFDDFNCRSFFVIVNGFESVCPRHFELLCQYTFGQMSESGRRLLRKRLTEEKYCSFCLPARALKADKIPNRKAEHLSNASEAGLGSRLSAYSSILVDRASTINHSYLFLERIVSLLNQGKIPAVISDRLSKEYLRRLENLVTKSQFSLIHLADHRKGKANRWQNSRAWIKVDPIDCKMAPLFESFRESGDTIFTG